MISFSHYSLYQVRCCLRVSPRLPVQIETTIPETTANGQPAAQPIISNGSGNGSDATNASSNCNGSGNGVSLLGSGGGLIGLSNGNNILSIVSGGGGGGSGNGIGIEADLRDQQHLHHQPSDIPPLPNNVHNLGSASIVNGAGASRVFQILYRNEEVTLRDVIYFRTHLLGEFQWLGNTYVCTSVCLQVCHYT